MQGWLEPQGPLGPRVYWIRRGVVIGALLLVIVLIGRLVSSGGSGETIGVASSTPSRVTPGTTDASAEQSPSESSTPQAQTSEQATSGQASASVESAEPTASGSGTIPVDTATAPPAPLACISANLTTTIKGSTDLRITDPQTFTITVVTDKETCHLDLATIGAKVDVTSGQDAIWSTASCSAWAPQGSWDLTAGQPVTFDVAWPTRRGHDCELDESTLLPGTYVATATVGDSGKFVMRLTN
ncbi:hypothetical protein HMPREF1531_01353 [Propionibacterium sp. oral taxon 192 str. F0372]|uniref:hypothetical protein n=1 Tax=Propionibacterium sp. oral taxon 192 TaxID=671222 RepID=UPI0003548F43|nr:hypothetical protein [Propionibacterium sp. oral taxon 192]EPH03294.1 hypothetical protein HMPREF1531_01353 [Propionibacterium sp. oral taxon 192 str. F0372]